MVRREKWQGILLLIAIVIGFAEFWAEASDSASGGEGKIQYRSQNAEKKHVFAQPKIAFVEGKSHLQMGESSPTIPVVGKVIGDQTRIKTPPEGRVGIDWEGERRLTVLEDSEVLIPAVAPDTGEAKIIRVIRGSVRWQGSLKSVPPYTVVLESGLTLLELPNGDFVFHYQPEKAEVTAKVYSGSLDFKAMNAESAIHLVKNQKASFKGLMEGGEIAYDILLAGRKIPQGKMQSIVTMEGMESALFSEENEAQREAARLARIAKAKAVRKAYLDSLQCQKPLAKLNQCSWTCEKSGKLALDSKHRKAFECQGKSIACVRRRCDANGKWVDAKAYEGESALRLCSEVQKVGACDY